MSRSRETREERVETHPTLTTPSRRSGSQVRTRQNTRADFCHFVEY